MTDCPRAGRLFGMCKWEARFDEMPFMSPEHVLHLRGQFSAEHLKAIIFRRVYVRDVCVRCGAVLERPKT